MKVSVLLQDIKVNIEIANPSTETVQVVEDAVQQGGYSLVIPPINFTITAVYGDSTVEVTRFSAYVERKVVVPEGVDPDKITTGVVIEPDGTVRHVPTKIIEIDGVYYAQINSLTNSTYSVIWNPIQFVDVENHWSKDSVNDMGSRLIVSGTGDGLYRPDRAITRAEFASIIVRALGLKTEKNEPIFTDVKPSDWYSAAVNTAYEFGLIKGFEDGTFRPNKYITREQAMVILMNAMSITGLNEKIAVLNIDEILSSYQDCAMISDWALNGVAHTIQAQVLTGRRSDEIAPKAFITRAEVAVLVKRLLQNSDLI